ncbi:MAG: hypothetical protein WD425_01200 [Nitrospirales bacterium]
MLSVVMSFFPPGETFQAGIGLVNAGGNPEPIGPRPLHIILTSDRASSSTVATIMALLATLEEAGVLPPEGTSQANQVIHGLIQLQSAVMKSSSPELGAYRVAAEAFWRSQHTEGPQGETGGEGLTSKVLGAFIDYDQEYSLWGDPNIVLALQEFNVTRADWMLVADLFHQAEVIFHEQGRSIHSVYQTWRMNMPGRKS